MKDLAILALILLMALSVIACSQPVHSDSQAGSNLLSEDEAKALARSETPLIDIIDSYVQTCGPVYRVVRGRTEAGSYLYVWVSGVIIAQVLEDDGVSADEAVRQVKAAFPGSRIDRVGLVYVPDDAKQWAIGEIRSASGNVFWQVTCIYGDAVSRTEHFVPKLVQP